MMLDFQQIVADVLCGKTGFEGTVPWLYLDTHKPPIVTTATGCAIQLAEALTLPFAINGVPATPREIAEHFGRVRAMAGGKWPSFYCYPGCLMLSDQACMDLLRKRFDAFTIALQSLFPAFDHYPVSAKAALLEMIYGLGAGKMLAQYKKLAYWVRLGDWAGAAAESAVNATDQAYDRRNAWVKSQFLQAVK